MSRSTALKPAEANGVLRTLLGALGLKTSTTLDPDGFAVASAPYALPDGTALALTASVRVNELRWVLQRAVPSVASEERLEWAAAVADEWCLGQAYRASSGDFFDVSASLYLGAGAPDVAAARGVLRELVQGAQWLRQGRVPRYTPPESAPLVSLDRVAEALAQLNLTPKLTPSGSLGSSFTQRGVPISVVFYVFGGRILNVRGRLHPRHEVRSYAEALRAIHEINRGLSYGQVGLLERRWPSYQLSISSEWTELDAVLLSWAISKVLFVVLHLHDQLALEERA